MLARGYLTPVTWSAMHEDLKTRVIFNSFFLKYKAWKLSTKYAQGKPIFFTNTSWVTFLVNLNSADGNDQSSKLISAHSVFPLDLIPCGQRGAPYWVEWSHRKPSSEARFWSLHWAGLPQSKLELLGPSEWSHLKRRSFWLKNNLKVKTSVDF